MRRRGRDQLDNDEDGDVGCLDHLLLAQVRRRGRDQLHNDGDGEEKERSRSA